MKVTTNTTMIARRRKLGTYATFGGLGILLAGMFASFRQQSTWSIWVSLGSLVVGFGLAQYGNYSLRRWGRTPRPDEVVETSLKGLDDRHHYYAWSLPVPYVLLSPNGLYSFTLRDQTGEISVTGSDWHSKFSLMRLFLLFQEGLGNPTRESLEAAERLRQWILTEAPGLDVPVRQRSSSLTLVPDLHDHGSDRPRAGPQGTEEMAARPRQGCHFQDRRLPSS